MAEKDATKKNGYFKDILIGEGSTVITLDDMINKCHDPDLMFFYIKQLERNLREGVTLESIPENKRLILSIYSKLDVFRNTFQFLEEFGIYFLSYLDSTKDMVKKLVETRPKDVESFFKSVLNNEQDSFALSNGSSNYRELLKKVFAYDIVSGLELDSDVASKEEIPKKIEESINFFEQMILDLANFYLEFLPLYTAIKHGTRIFPHKIDSIKITGQENYEVNLGMDYVTAVCKDERGKPFFLEYPIDYLLDYSIRISEQIHIVFEYLRRIVKYKISNPKKVGLTFFKQVPKTKPKLDYIKAWNSNATIIMPKPKVLKNELVNKPITKKFAFNLSISRKSLVFHTKYDESISDDYPLLIEMSSIPDKDLKPRIKEVVFKFIFNIYDLNIRQYMTLLKAVSLFKNKDINGVEIYDDLRNHKVGAKAPLSNLNISDIPIILEENLIEFLSKLQQITSKKIPVPLGLSPFQESIITRNIGKSLSKIEAENILIELQKKENKAKYSTFVIEKIDSKGNLAYSEELGKICGAPNFEVKNVKNEEKFKNEILENPQRFIEIKGIDSNPDELIKEFKLFVSDPIKNRFPKIIMEPKIDKEKYEPKFNLIFKCNFGEPTFWHQDYFIRITLKLLIDSVNLPDSQKM